MSRRIVSVKKLLFFLLAASSVGFFWPLAVRADLGPKPSMDFEFVYATETALTIVDGQQIVCEQSDCGDGVPLEQAGPQGFSCGENSCSSLAYSYGGNYSRLVITFSDGKTRTSNIFYNESFAPTFTVTVADDALTVADSTSPVVKFIDDLTTGDASFTYPNNVFFQAGVALIITLIVEILCSLGIAYFVFKKLKSTVKKLLLVVLIMNCVSVPALWAILYALSSASVMLLIAEIGVLLLETLILYAFLKPNLSFISAFVASAVLNMASFAAGLLILSFVY